MAKVNIKSEKIIPFGGIYYASKDFYALSLDKVINGTLGVRSSTYNGYLCAVSNGTKYEYDISLEGSKVRLFFFI